VNNPRDVYRTRWLDIETKPSSPDHVAGTPGGASASEGGSGRGSALGSAPRLGRSGGIRRQTLSGPPATVGFAFPGETTMRLSNRLTRLAWFSVILLTALALAAPADAAKVLRRG